MLGKTLAHYKILEKIGEGGMGEVYLAEDTKLKRQVALKVLPPEMASDEARLERFQREAETVAALDHPNIVTMYSVEEDQGVHFLTMSYIDGKRLDQIVPEGGLSLERIFDIAVPLADALSAAHEKGITHRDLKPANIMVNEEGRVKVLDFGLAKLHEGSPVATGEDEPTRALTQEGLVVGTVPYMSPEQVEGKGVDQRTDIFSFGILLYEMATGQRPFGGENSAQVVSSLLRDDPPSVAEVKADLPFHLSRIARHCLEKDPKKRFQSALDLRNELETLKQEVASGQIRPASSSTVMAAQPQAEKPKWLWPAVAVGALLLLVVGWMVMRGGTGSGDSGAGTEAGADAKPSVAVLYFDNLTGDEEMNWLRTGLADMLVTDLSQLTGVRVVGTDRVYQILKDLDMLDESITSAETVQEVAEQADVKTVLLGSFAKVGDTLRINVKVQDADSGEIIGTERAEGPGGDNLFVLVDTLSSSLRGRFESAGSLPLDGDQDLMDVTTASLEAYRYYSEGVHLADLDKNEEALALLEKAVELDPGFAMALRKLAVVLGNENREEESQEYSRRAVENSDRLPAKEKYLVQAYHYSDYPNTMSQGIEAYQNLIEIEPDNFTALHNLALQLAQMERWDEAVSLFERAASAGDDFQFLYHNMANSYGHLGRVAEARNSYERLRQIEPESVVALFGEGFFEIAWGDPERALELFAQAEELRPGTFPGGVGPVNANILLERWDDATSYAQKMAASNRPAVRRQGLQALSRLAFYRGDSKEALSFLTSAIEEHPETDVVQADLQSNLGFALMSAEDLSGAVEAFDRSTEMTSGTWQEFAANLGLAHARASLGELSAARSAAGLAFGLVESNPSQWPQRVRHYLDGVIALGEEDFPGAIAELEAAEAMVPEHLGFDNGGTNIRFALSEAYMGAGDGEKAAEQLQKIVDAGQRRVFRSTMYVRSYYLLGQIALERGDLEEARTYYQRFLDHWADGDMDRDRVAQAKRVVG
jgi:tetratricopeptide (TPR) repeat protein/predicted Ser/Thr protein kinase